MVVGLSLSLRGNIAVTTGSTTVISLQYQKSLQKITTTHTITRHTQDASYIIANAANIALTKSIAMEYDSRNIRELIHLY